MDCQPMMLDIQTYIKFWGPRLQTVDGSYIRQAFPLIDYRSFDLLSKIGIPELESIFGYHIDPGRIFSKISDEKLLILGEQPFLGIMGVCKNKGNVVLTYYNNNPGTRNTIDSFYFCENIFSLFMLATVSTMTNEAIYGRNHDEEVFLPDEDIKRILERAQATCIQIDETIVDAHENMWLRSLSWGR